MSLLFTPVRIGAVTLDNRLVQSATYEGMADVSGAVTDDLIERYRGSARGGIGLIIPGHLYVHPQGKAMKYQTGIHSDEMIPGLERLVRAVHGEGGKIAFQLNHAGRQTIPAIAGKKPIAPSSYGWDPRSFVKPSKMNQKMIVRTIESFQAAAVRAVAAGVDAIQLHAAHGNLINQFLSPYFNHRRDAWGGSDEKRFRFLKSVVVSVRKKMPARMPLLLKLNTRDYTPWAGVTPYLAKTYAAWLVDIGIDMIELSCGTSNYSFMNMCRGDVPVEAFVSGMPAWKKRVGRVVLNRLKGRYDLEEGYNVAAARTIKPAIGDVPLSVVGGFRRRSRMEEALNKGFADLISMSRPFICEPNLARRFKEGRQEEAACRSCNRCLAAAASDRPVKCYCEELPKSNA